MKKELNPKKIDVAQLAHSAESLSGTTPIGDMARLWGDLALVPRENDHGYGVQWVAKGYTEGDGTKLQIWLAVQATATVPQICQRCLNLMDFPIEFEHHYRFVATEREAEQQDELVEEDLLVLTKSLDLIEVIEDELLMAMPPIPVHDHCPVSLPHQSIDPDYVELAQRPNTFGALAGLKSPSK